MKNRAHTNYKLRQADTPSLQKTVAPAPNLIWFYGLWVALAWISAAVGYSTISSGAALFLLGGISSTNFFFVSLDRSRSGNGLLTRMLVTYQTIMGIAWTTAYFYYSSNAGDLVLGMYMTVLMYAVFYLDTRTILKLGCGSVASYLIIASLKVVGSQDLAYPLADSIRLLVLAAVVGCCYLYSRQLQALREQLQLHNDELQDRVERVTRIAEKDDLTESYNRRYLMDAISREQAVSNRTGERFSILLLDIDHFKSINDRYGHVVGDQILTDFARRVKAELRGMDSVNSTERSRSFGRYGGEEFIAILPGTTLVGARRCGERIRSAIAKHLFRDNYYITVSVGVAEYQPDESVSDLLTRADQALYQAKRNGRNLVRCSDPLVESSEDTVPRLRILK